MSWIKDIWEILEKIGVSKKTIIIIFVVILVFFAFWIGYKYGIDNQTASAIDPIIDQGGDIEQKESSENNCIGGMFVDNIDSWKIKYYSEPDNDGFYCPKSKNMPYPRMWYKESIPTKFESIEVRYKLKDESNNTSTVPMFIFVLGKEDTESDKNDILLFHIPEEESHLASFQKRIMKNSDWIIERLSPKEELDHPIKYGEEVELKVYPENIKDMFSFDFLLDYISANSGRKVKSEFNLPEVLLSDPNVESEFSQIKIGIGTKEGFCIKPMSFKFCY